MVKKIKSTNPQVTELILLLRKQSREKKASIWLDIAEYLSKPRRRRITVNLSRLNRFSPKNGTVVVPGKVLGTGKISQPITVAAFAFSEKAKKKLESVKGKCLTISEIIAKNPKGTNVKIIR